MADGWTLQKRPKAKDPFLWVITYRNVLFDKILIAAMAGRVPKHCNLYFTTLLINAFLYFVLIFRITSRLATLQNLSVRKRLINWSLIFHLRFRMRSIDIRFQCFAFSSQTIWMFDCTIKEETNVGWHTWFGLLGDNASLKNKPQPQYFISSYIVKSYLECM